MKCSICYSKLKQVNKGCALFDERFECTNKECYVNRKDDELDEQQYYWDVFGKMHCKDIITNMFPPNFLLRRILIDGNSDAFNSIEREEKNEE